MKIRHSIFLLMIYTAGLRAQGPQVHGYITDKVSGEAIHGAIASDSNSFQYTYANRDGYYNLGLSSGKHILLFTASGYQRSRIAVDVYSSQEIKVELVKLKETESDTISNLHHSINDYRSGHSAPLASQVANMPAILCVQDPVKFLQYLPGVNGGIEGLAGLYVRGGNADQNLVTMDGLPIYGNGHMLGLLSNFNADQVRDVQFYRGAMPARYGGRAGSVLDVSLIDGSQSAGSSSLSYDLLALNYNLNGPLNRSGTTTGSFGIRRSWFDLLLRHKGATYLFYNFHDINAKVVFRPTRKDKISVWLYNGRDKYGQRDTSYDVDSFNIERRQSEGLSITWQNTLAGINYSRNLSNRHFMSVVLGVTRFSYKYPYDLEAIVISDTSIDKLAVNIQQRIFVTDLIFKPNFEFNLNSNNYFRYGLEVINHNFKPDVTRAQILINNGVRLDSMFGSINVQNAQEVSAYAEWETNLAAGLKMNIGGRVWTFLGRDRMYVRPEPRIFLSQILKDKKALKLSFSIANQGIHQLASVNGNLPNDVWFPTSKNFTPQQNIQVNGGFYQPWKDGIEFSIDMYYKWMNGITDKISTDASLLAPNYWEKMLAQGKGTAYGAEVLLMKKTGSWNGLCSYTFSKSTRTIDLVNFGNTYLFRWDRTHKVALQGVYIASPTWRINFSLVVMSGNMVSVPSGKYVTADGDFIYDYSEKNNYRMPFYKRVDFGFTKRRRQDLQGFSKKYWGMNFYNLFAFRNPLFVDLDKDDEGVVQAYGVSFFTLIPSIFFRWEF